MAKRFVRTAVLFAAWASLLGVGFWRLYLYANTPGASTRSISRWPTNSTLHKEQKSAALLVFAHPRCPCSRASIGELERLMPYLQNKLQVFVIFYKPKSKSIMWAKSSLWQQVQNIPGVETIIDEEGAESSKFGALVSGQTLLYSAQGELIFNGGITPARGHMGDSDGRDAILQFAQSGKISLNHTPIFGCSLVNPERASAGEPR